MHSWDGQSSVDTLRTSRHVTHNEVRAETPSLCEALTPAPPERWQLAQREAGRWLKPNQEPASSTNLPQLPRPLPTGVMVAHQGRLVLVSTDRARKVAEPS